MIRMLQQRTRQIRHFQSSWWLPGPHLQTIWPLYCPRRLDLRVRRERLEIPDGDFLDLDWVGDRHDGPIVVVLHGLAGSIHSHYVRGLMVEFDKRGWRGVLMHFRGCSGEPNRLPRTYHAGDTEDIQYVIDAITKREPNTPIGAVGFSMGGNVLLKWLGELGGNVPITAATAVSVPFDLARVVDFMGEGKARLYQWNLIRSLQKALHRKFDLIGPEIDLSRDEVKTLKTFRTFDDRVVAPLHGFEGAEDYYRRASCRPHLGEISAPTLVIHAEDDPFMPDDILPENHEFSSSVNLEVTDCGGHVGFVSGRRPWAPVFWLEQRIPTFLAEHL